MFRIDHDEKFNQTTHLQYQPEKKAALAQLQLALRQRTGGRPGAVRGRGLRQRAERDRQHRGRVRPDAGSTGAGGTLLRERACDADHADQSDGAVPRVACTVPRTSRYRLPARRTTTTIRRASRPAISSTWGWGTTTSFTATRYKVERSLDGRQSDQQRGALQLSFRPSAERTM